MAGVICSFVWIFLRSAAPCAGGQAGWDAPSCWDGCSRGCAVGSEGPQHPASPRETSGFVPSCLSFVSWGGEACLGLVSFSTDVDIVPFLWDLIGWGVGIVCCGIKNDRRMTLFRNVKIKNPVQNVN